jgi:hypothetical protein
VKPANPQFLIAHEQTESLDMLGHPPVGRPQRANLLGLSTTKGGGLRFELMDAIRA